MSENAKHSYSWNLDALLPILPAFPIGSRPEYFPWFMLPDNEAERDLNNVDPGANTPRHLQYFQYLLKVQYSFDMLPS